MLWIVLTAGWNKARPIGKRTGEVGGLGYWSAMPNKRARGRSATVDQTMGFISDSDLADTGIESRHEGEALFAFAEASVECAPHPGRFRTAKALFIEGVGPGSYAQPRDRRAGCLLRCATFDIRYEC